VHLFSAPRHDGDSGYAVCGGAFNYLSADSDINQGIAFSVKHPLNLGFFKKQGGVFAECRFLIRQFALDADGPDLAA